MHGYMYGCMHSCVCARLCRFTKSARVRSILGMVFWLDLFLRCGAAAHPNSVCDQIFATTISLSCFYYIEHEAMRAFQIQDERSISWGAAVLPALAPEPRDSSDTVPSATQPQPAPDFHNRSHIGRRFQQGALRPRSACRAGWLPPRSNPERHLFLRARAAPRHPEPNLFLPSIYRVF